MVLSSKDSFAGSHICCLIDVILFQKYTIKNIFISIKKYVMLPMFYHCPQDGHSLCIDVPPEFGRDASRFNATLGHKANHDFEASESLEACLPVVQFGHNFLVSACQNLAMRPRHLATDQMDPTLQSSRTLLSWRAAGSP